MKPIKIISVNGFPDDSPTPARASRQFGIVYINKPVWGTLPESWQRFILFHEFGHIVLNTSNELSADEFASKHFLGTEPYSLKNSVKLLESILAPEYRMEHKKRVEAQINRALNWDKLHGTTPLNNFSDMIEKNETALQAKTKVVSLRKTPVTLEWNQGIRKVFINPTLIRKPPKPKPEEIKSTVIITAEEKKVLDEPIINQNIETNMQATGWLPNGPSEQNEEQNIQTNSQEEKTFFGMSASGGYVWGVLTVLILFLVVTFLIVRFTPPRKISY